MDRMCHVSETIVGEVRNNIAALCRQMIGLLLHWWKNEA
jgi:hypothetical protein